MSSRLLVLVAGDSIDRVAGLFGSDLWHLLADKGFVNRTTVGSVGFCRDLKKQTLLAVLPKAFGLVSNRSHLGSAQVLRENVFRLIRIFNKVWREGGFGLELIETNRTFLDLQDSSDPVLDSLEAALKLRQDFLLHGIYMRKKARHVETSPSHPINWSRTIKKFPPVIDDDSVVFPATVHRARKRDFTHSLTTLQCSCLDEIFRLTGEGHLFSGHARATIAPKSRGMSTTESILRRLNSEVFDERGRSLLKLIGAYQQIGRLRSSEHTERDQVLAYTADFERIWEFMLRKVFGQASEKRTTSQGKWHPFPPARTEAGITPEVDIFAEVSGSPVILDAKDYRIICPPGERFGHASDHYKQIIYGMLIGSNGEKPKPTNILLFPGMDQENMFQINGCHHWKDIPGSVVFEVAVDYSKVVQAWLGERPANAQAELEKLVNDLKEFEASLPVPADR